MVRNGQKDRRTDRRMDGRKKRHIEVGAPPKKKLNLTLESIGVSPVNIHRVAQHSHASNVKGKLKKVLNVYKENISAAYVSDIEIEEPPPIYDRYQE